MALTPMMRQYLEIKEQNKDAVLFFRLGDFYEMFFDDARLVSKELELTLTGKDCGLSERAPMCGVPYHAADAYIGRLIERGYKVAICEQTSDPALSKGLVEREVTRVITPGTIIEIGLLDEREPNYILSLCLRGQKAGISYCDVSTGEFFVYEFSGVTHRLGDELSRISPKEILIDDKKKLAAVPLPPHVVLSELNAGDFEYSSAVKALCLHFAKKNINDWGLADLRLGVCAAGALIKYLNDTQKNALKHISQIKRYEVDRFMVIDRVASANLELTESLRSRSRRGSLLSVLDKTVTSMGSRMLRSWIEQPLIEINEIEKRQDAVECLKEDMLLADELKESLSSIYDIERLLSRIAYDTVNARDCLALNSSLKVVPDIKALINKTKPTLLRQIDHQLDPLDSLSLLIDCVIDLDAPISVKDGGMIKDGYDEQLDKLRDAARNGKEWLSDLERQEKESTGIKNLKVGFNRVFGYYIEVTKSFYDLVPFRYVRKQTLANCERFITEELKEIEKTVLGAEENAIKLEYEIFSGVREKLKDALPALQRTAHGIKMLDTLLSLSLVALENDYTRPMLNEQGVYEIVNGRHPVVEQAIGRERFVPNDTKLNAQERVMIITGPNMAGKSTYMRQVALIALMAHMGGFIPAESANISITDRIFTRIGASDDLYGGQSTFMVEMNELANILRFATDRSLLVLDEVGRGTSTFDGLSIAWAAVEHIAAKKLGACTLFATHYHELSELEGQLEGVVDYRITAKEQGNDVIFLRKIVPGGADRSFGVAVASLAGLPKSLIQRARQIMARLEVNGGSSIGQSILDKSKNAGDRQIELTDYRPMELIEEIRDIDVMGMSPIDALNKLFELNEKARRI